MACKLNALLLLLVLAVPYNLFTATPYWVMTGKYAVYQGIYEYTQSFAGINVTFRYETKVTATILDVSDAVLVNITYFKELLQAPQGSTEFKPTGIEWKNLTLQKIDYQAGTIWKKTYYPMFYLPKTYIDIEYRLTIDVILLINETFYIGPMNFTVMEKTKLDTPLADWGTREVWRLTTTIDISGAKVIINLYYDADSLLLLAIEYYYPDTGRNEWVIISETNVKPPQLVDKIILFMFSIEGLIVVVMAVVVIGIIKLIRSRIRRAWTRPGVVRTAYGVERLR